LTVVKNELFKGLRRALMKVYVQHLEETSIFLIQI
jgi:hypothetical protein